MMKDIVSLFTNLALWTLLAWPNTLLADPYNLEIQKSFERLSELPKNASTATKVKSVKNFLQSFDAVDGYPSFVNHLLKIDPRLLYRADKTFIPILQTLLSSPNEVAETTELLRNYLKALSSDGIQLKEMAKRLHHQAASLQASEQLDEAAKKLAEAKKINDQANRRIKRFFSLANQVANHSGLQGTTGTLRRQAVLQLSKGLLNEKPKATLDLLVALEKNDKNKVLRSTINQFRSYAEGKSTKSGKHFAAVLAESQEQVNKALAKLNKAKSRQMKPERRENKIVQSHLIKAQADYDQRLREVDQLHKEMPNKSIQAEAQEHSLRRLGKGGCDNFPKLFERLITGKM